MVHTTNSSDMNWDLRSFFPEFGGKEMQTFKESLESDINTLLETAGELPSLSPETADQWEDVFLKAEDIIQRLSHIASYVGCLVAGDAANESYQNEEAGISMVWSTFSKVEVELLRAIKTTDDDVFNAFVERKTFEGARYYMRRMREESHRQMSREKEHLAADLNVDGLDAWGRLYDTLSGKLTFDMEYPDGRRETLPMSQRRSLMEKPDREIRRAAFEGGNKAWAGCEDVTAAALNAIAGTRLTLNRHRGVDHFLEVALFQSAITRKTLDAMFEAIYDNLDVPRRILALKARCMQRDTIAWYDLGAPLDIGEDKDVTWNRAKNLVQESFSSRYPGLGDFLEKMLEQRWIESEPRAGKRPGGFCTGSLLNKESRIFMTFNKTMGDVLTLAHEAGHAFHSHILRDVRPYAHLYPMTLAETASTFGEQILVNGILAAPDIHDSQKALVLDMELNHAAVYLMDIPVRFEFEKQLYEERSRSTIGVSGLKEIMVETQQRIFQDILEPQGVDPYFWASKLHFYITGTTFYNFPYTFGFLLSRGLYAMFKEQGEQFLPRYEGFLRLTGSDTAPRVAQRTIGRDLEERGFWEESIKSLEEPLQTLEELLPKIKKI